MNGIAISKMPVVAATLTHLNMKKEAIDRSKPCAILIEEAAEVLEPLVFNALPASICHVIFIGDHQQLRPRLRVSKMAELGFGVSAMERLVALGLPSVQLQYQNRMLPEIAVPLKTLYPKLMNGPLASRRLTISGLAKNLFL